MGVLPDGRAGVWWLPHPCLARPAVRSRKAAVIALLDDQDRVLMLWRHRFVPDRWGWELPGGLVEDGEEPAVARRRR